MSCWNRCFSPSAAAFVLCEAVHKYILSTYKLRPRDLPIVTSAPPCLRLGRQCTELRVTLRIGSLEDGTESLDHEATWLLGHTQHITFLELWQGEGDLYTEAVLHVPCRFLRREGSAASCKAFGYSGTLAPPRRRRQLRQLGGDDFRVVEKRRMVERRLPAPPPAPRALPVVGGANPCAGAPCRTADNRHGAACCRDLQVEIMCTKRQAWLEALVRSRQSPYLCKIERGGDYSLDVEMISACGYLEQGSVNCSLHGRKRRDGRTAKPDLCFEWPPKRQTLHPGCVFIRKRTRSA